MLNALEMFENFKKNRAQIALIDEQLRMAPLKEEVLRFGLEKGRSALENDTARVGILSRQQEAAAKYNQGRLGLMAQANSLRANAPKKGPNAPSGFRFTADGNMEAIPGGPADLKAQAEAQKKATGADDVGIALGTLRDAYNRLETGGGITSTANKGVSNLIPALSASPVGQLAGKALGTQNQSARNDIAMSRPALLAALMKATGLSAKQMDSNTELKLWLSTATDPTLDVESNRRALDNIEKKYIGGGAPAPSGGWDNNKETRYQELLRKQRGAK